MTSDWQRQRMTDAVKAFEKVLTDYADVLGPQVCKAHQDNCDMDTDDCVPVASSLVMQRGWIVLSEWSEVSGMGSLEYMMPMEQPLSVSIGLVEAGKRIIFNDMLG